MDSLDVVYRMVRIFTPFLCSVATIIDGILFFMDKEPSYIVSGVGGYSLAVTLCFIAYSRRMCIWYKTNLFCLLSVPVIGILYYFIPFGIVEYLFLVTLIATVGVGAFMIYLFGAIKKNTFKKFVKP